MKLNEFKAEVDQLVKDGCGECDVVVSLSENSFGIAPFTNVNGVHPGIDWECGQVRISTDEKIIRMAKDRDNPSPKICMKSFGEGMFPYVCPECGMRVRKDDRYCSHCGQNIKGVVNPKPVNGLE